MPVLSRYVAQPLLLAACLVQTVSAAATDRPVRPVKAAAVVRDRCARIEPAPGAVDVPAGDIFGILSPTDLGDACSFGFAAETTGRASKRDGHYVATTTKFQFTYTYSDQLSFAVSPFVSAFSWKNVEIDRFALLTSGIGIDRTSLSATDFDGFSADASWRLLMRSAGQPLSMTLSAEPRWFRRGPLTGFPADGKQIELKLFADIALSDSWFAAANVIYGLGTECLRIQDAEVIKASALGLLGAVTWQPYKSEIGTVEGVFVGAEARYVTGYAGLALDTKVAEALFAGPTLAIGFKGGAMLNLVWSPQVWGRAQPASAPGPLDLDTFERHQFRIKFATPL
jgi:hypothetical protein